MRFTTLVLIPSGTEDIVEAVTHQMKPYDVNRTMPPRKEVAPADEVAYLAEVYDISLDDLETLSRELHEESGFECWVEDGTIYWMTTDNSQGYWDGWILHSLTEDVWRALDVPQKVAPFAIITPDGVWHEMGNDFVYNPDMREASDVVLHQRATTLLQDYPTYLAVVLDCHR